MAADSVFSRARPTPELLDRLHGAKLTLRAVRTELPLRDKVAAVIELQRALHPLLARQRALRSWEQPWNVTP